MGVDTFFYREYAYAERGTKVIGRISGKKYRRSGIGTAKLGKEMISSLQSDGSMDSRLFERWFQLCLLPGLPPSTTIVMDNASFHRKSKLILFTQKLEHGVIFLPPYSPELNPIENFWAWLKGKLKKILLEFDAFDDALGCCFNWI